MIQGNRPDDTSLGCFLNAAFTAILISIIAILGIGLIFNAVDLPRTEAAPEATPEVVIQIVTATPLPASPTPLPTATLPPTATPVPPSPTLEPTAAEQTTGEGTANTSAAYAPEIVASGETLFALCSACHGPDGRGLPNLGKDLVGSEFIHTQTDDDLLTFIKTGRPMWDAANTTGMDMPPKGGNPALTDEEILHIIAYIRSLSSQQ